MKQIVNNYFENKADKILSVKEATILDAEFIERVFSQNRAALHAEDISLIEWQGFLSAGDPDEKHFIVCNDTTPVGYIKINGLLNPNEVWISTLIVAKEQHRQGIGSFAISYAEQYVKSLKFELIKIQTDSDNIPAISCYTKCGYQIYAKGSRIKFYKKL